MGHRVPSRGLSFALFVNRISALLVQTVFYRLTPVSKPVNKRLVILLYLGQETHKHIKPIIHLKLVNP